MPSSLGLGLDMRITTVPPASFPRRTRPQCCKLNTVEISRQSASVIIVPLPSISEEDAFIPGTVSTARPPLVPQPQGCTDVDDAPLPPTPAALVGPIVPAPRGPRPVRESIARGAGESKTDSASIVGRIPPANVDAFGDFFVESSSSLAITATLPPPHPWSSPSSGGAYRASSSIR